MSALNCHLNLTRFGRFVLGVATKLVFISFAGIAALALFLLLLGETAQAKVFAGGTLAASVFAMYMTVCLAYRKLPRHRLLAGSLLAIGLAALCIAFFNAPPVKTGASSSLQSVYASRVLPSALSPTVLVPELDQVTLGSYLLPIIDPHMDFAQAARFRQTWRSVYAELEASGEFSRAGSALGDAYSEMFLGIRRLDHFYVYYPKASSGKRPTLVFLHGWLGNFKAYIWLWSKFAERNGWVVVCPTFGNGQWNKSAGIDKLRETFEFCRNDPRIDSDNIYLAGMSNAAVAVTRAVMETPQSARGYIYIAPVLEGDLLASDQFQKNAEGKPILVVYGGGDNRISKDYVASCVQTMRDAGLHVQANCHEQEEHLLLVSDFDGVLADIELWLKTSGNL